MPRPVRTAVGALAMALYHCNPNPSHMAHERRARAEGKPTLEAVNRSPPHSWED